MKGKNKKLFGFIGLGLVSAVTAIAYSLPAPGAAAQDVNISVTVLAQPGSARITSPEDGTVLTSRDATVSVSYNMVKTIKTSVSCTDGNGKQVYNHTEEVTPEAENGVVNTTFNLPEEFEEEALNSLVCVAALTATDYNNTSTTFDSVSFSYRSMSLPNGGSENNPNKPSDDPNKPSDGFDDKNNPEVDVEVSEDVIEVTVQVYDMDGKAVFVNANGEPTPLKTTKDAFRDGKVTITLPMSEYHAKAGKYVAYFTATNSKGEVVSINEYWFEYWPVVDVDTPNSGSIFASMNLSRADYLWAGLAAFGSVIAFAIFLMFRKSRR